MNLKALRGEIARKAASFPGLNGGELVDVRLLATIESALLQYAEAVLGEPPIFDQSALDAASMAVHLMLLREGSSWGTKACEEMGRVFMVEYRRARGLE